MKKNRLKVKTFFLLMVLCLQFKLSAQFTDTTTNVYQDIDLISWIESYIVKAGFVHKTPKGYQVPLFNDYYKKLSDVYSLNIIERQECDTLSIILYWLHAGTDNDRPVIVSRTIIKNQKSKFKAIGRKRDLESLSQIHQLFEEYKKFTEATQLFCYKMLLQNYQWRISKVEE
jgi:hypothetical protein